MKKEEFEIIKTNLENRIQNCKKYLDKILTTDDLLNLTLKDLFELRKFCKQEVDEMTTICMVDLYHVLGMGNLTVVQQNTFLKLFKEYSTYRSDLKALGTKFNNLEELPHIPTRTKFKLLKLGDITLYAGRGLDEEEICETVEDYTKSKNLPECSPEKPLVVGDISFDGTEVKFPKSDVKVFMSLSQGCGLVETLLKKAKNKGDYIGFSWRIDSEGNIVGTVKDDSAKNRLLVNMK